MANTIKGINISNGDGNITNIISSTNVSYIKFYANLTEPLTHTPTINFTPKLEILDNYVGTITKDNKEIGIFKYNMSGSIYFQNDYNFESSVTIYLYDFIKLPFQIYSIASGSYNLPITLSLYSDTRYKYYSSYLIGIASGGSAGPYTTISKDDFYSLKNEIVKRLYITIDGYIGITDSNVLNQIPQQILLN